MLIAKLAAKMLHACPETVFRSLFEFYRGTVMGRGGTDVV